MRKISIHYDCSVDEIHLQLGIMYGKTKRNFEQLIVVVDKPSKLPDTLLMIAGDQSRLPVDLVVCHGVTDVLLKARQLRNQFKGPEIPQIHVAYWMPQIMQSDPDQECNGALPFYISSQNVQRQINSGEIDKFTFILEK